MASASIEFTTPEQSTSPQIRPDGVGEGVWGNGVDVGVGLKVGVGAGVGVGVGVGVTAVTVTDPSWVAHEMSIPCSSAHVVTERITGDTPSLERVVKLILPNGEASPDTLA
jgi:hypothetical protein